MSISPWRRRLRHAARTTTATTSPSSKSTSACRPRNSANPRLSRTDIERKRSRNVTCIKMAQYFLCPYLSTAYTQIHRCDIGAGISWRQNKPDSGDGTATCQERLATPVGDRSAGVCVSEVTISGRILSSDKQIQSLPFLLIIYFPKTLFLYFCLLLLGLSGTVISITLAINAG